jgi:hypothetical protein
MHQGSWDTTCEAGSAGECVKLGLAIIGYTERRCVDDYTYGDLIDRTLDFSWSPTTYLGT